MTSKELMYIEDALGHEQYFLTKFGEIANSLQDGELKNCVNAMTAKHQVLFDGFMNLL